jgi:hypothetical protein
MVNASGVPALNSRSKADSYHGPEHHGPVQLALCREGIVSRAEDNGRLAFFLLEENVLSR